MFSAKNISPFQFYSGITILSLLLVFPQLTFGESNREESTVIYSDNFSTEKWETWYSNESTNDLMKPDFSIVADIAYESGGKCVAITGNKNEQAKGSYRKDIGVSGVDFVQNQYYRFTVWYAVRNVTGINERIFACVTWGSVWYTKKLVPVAVEHKNEISWIRAERIIKIEKSRPKVVMELTAAWLPVGSAVYYGKVMIENLPGYTPKSRKITVGTIDGSPPKESTLLGNRDYYIEQIRNACNTTPDLVDVVCLPEYFNSYSVSRKNLFDIAVNMDTSAYMQGFKDVAKECNVNIVGSVVAIKNGIPYNTGFLINRVGKIVDTQRKLHIPMQEYWWGGGRGDELKIIQADFGKIGILICWDYYLTDAIRTLALKGADIIFVPIEGDSRSADGQKRKAAEYIGVASALQNNIPMVFSFSPVNVGRGNQSLIIDRDGTVEGRSNINKSTVLGEVELCKNDDKFFVDFFMDRRPGLHNSNSDASQLALWIDGSVKYVPNPSMD